ncbi:MAG: hypothetical protein K6T91_03815 [Firmicutes bacterium]|nr:hypothetical protein [Bacillota bacterium]
MAAKDFSVGDVLRDSWETFKGSPGLFVGLALISFIISVIASSIDNAISGPGSAGGFRVQVSIFSFLAGAFIGMGAINVALKSIKGEKAELGDFFAAYPLYLIFLVSNFLFSLAVGIGTIFLIIPGIYLFVRLQFFGYYIVDKNARGTDAIIGSLQRSWELTKGIAGKVFLLDLALLGFIILGAIPLGLGLLIVFPLVFIANAYVYRKFEGAVASKAETALEGPTAQ